MFAVPKTNSLFFLGLMCVLIDFFLGGGKSIFAHKQSYAVHVL